jgi:hypothetical protein
MFKNKIKSKQTSYVSSQTAWGCVVSRDGPQTWHFVPNKRCPDVFLKSWTVELYRTCEAFEYLWQFIFVSRVRHQRCYIRGLTKHVL